MMGAAALISRGRYNTSEGGRLNGLGGAAWRRGGPPSSCLSVLACVGMVYNRGWSVCAQLCVSNARLANERLSLLVPSSLS